MEVTLMVLSAALLIFGLAFFAFGIYRLCDRSSDFQFQGLIALYFGALSLAGAGIGPFFLVAF